MLYNFVISAYSFITTYFHSQLIKYFKQDRAERMNRCWGNEWQSLYSTLEHNNPLSNFMIVGREYWHAERSFLYDTQLRWCTVCRPHPEGLISNLQGQISLKDISWKMNEMKISFLPAKQSVNLRCHAAKWHYWGCFAKTTCRMYSIYSAAFSTEMQHSYW